MKKHETNYHIIFKYILWLVAVSTVIIGVLIKNWSIVFNSLFYLVVSLLPEIITFFIKRKQPPWFDFLSQFFIFMAIYLGRALNFYSLITQWDSILHVISGIILSFFAYGFIYNFNSIEATKIIHPFFMALFSLAFSMACAAGWEIWEFGGDRIFGLLSQNNSLFDTMKDIICGTLGGLIATFIGYFDIRKGRGLYRVMENLNKKAEVTK